MADVCVVGGTRFFGKLLVKRLLDAGHRVTVVNRGITPDPFGTSVRRLVADLNVPGELAWAVTGERFDAVVHQMCYTSKAAVEAAEAFGDRAGKFVLTSSMEVYNKDTFRWRIPAPAMSVFAREEELDTAHYAYDTELPWEDPAYLGANYGEESGRPRPRCWPPPGCRWSSPGWPTYWPPRGTSPDGSTSTWTGSATAARSWRTPPPAGPPWCTPRTRPPSSPGPRPPG